MPCLDRGKIEINVILDVILVPIADNVFYKIKTKNGILTSLLYARNQKFECKELFIWSKYMLIIMKYY